MARKKTAPDSVNPFQRMFGAYLRLERTQLGLTSKAVADRLDLTDTYLRLAESGRATLNQALVFKIIEVFADSNAPTHDSRTIDFRRLALFMVGMHWVGAEMASLVGLAPGRRATEALASRVSDFECFVQRTKHYFECGEDDSSEQKAFLAEVAAPEVGLFLRSDTYGRADIEAIREGVLPLRDLLDLPTMNIDILLSLKQSLDGQSFVHAADVASKWEAKRSAQFRFVRGVYNRPDLIVSESNLRCFKYEYLAERRFEAIQMVFLNSTLSPAVLKNDFINRLNESRGSHSPGLRTEEAAKIHFCCPSNARHQEFKAALDQVLSRPSTSEHDAYWSFETHSGLEYGFVSKSTDIRNLSLKDAVQNVSLFKTVWDGLNGSPKS